MISYIKCKNTSFDPCYIKTNINDNDREEDWSGETESYDYEHFH